MKRTIFSLCLLLLLALAPSASAAAGDQLVFNGSVDAPDDTKTMPAGWSPSWWADDNIEKSTFTWSTDAHTGPHSVRIDVSGYTAPGDSKWLPDAVPVKGGTYYTFSDWYKSDRTSAVSVYYETPDSNGDGVDEGHWANLFSGIAPADAWTQYTTGFTMPAGAVRAQFVHLLAGDGYLMTDDYSVIEKATPPGFSKPMVSLTFDDGSQGFWTNAREALKAKGFKTTQYVPTKGLVGPNHDPFLMTPDEITTLAREGNEIGAHSVTHPDLTTVSDAQLTDELGISKSTLEAIPDVPQVQNFAYPYGAYDARVIAAEQAAGYRSGRSVEEGYNSKLDIEPYDIRVQNMTPDTTLDQYKSWLDYAKAHHYWLVIVYHEVIPDSAPRCKNNATDPDPCLGDFDTKVASFKDQLDAISGADLGSDVVTVQDALDAIDAEMHGPVAGTAKITPANPTTNDTLTAVTDGFTDPDGDPLTYQYQWKVNGTVIAGATDKTFDLSVAGHGEGGDLVSVDVKARDPKGHLTTGVSGSVTVVTPAPQPASTPNPAPSATPAPAAVTDRLAPAIVVTNPKARTYKVGRSLKLKLSCTDASGCMEAKATLRRKGGKARTVKQGAKLRLARPGRYVLRVTAKDRWGNTATKTVRFRVVRK